MVSGSSSWNFNKLLSGRSLHLVNPTLHSYSIIEGHSKWDFSFSSTPVSKCMRAGILLSIIKWLMNLIKSGHAYVNLQAWFSLLQATCLVWPQAHC